MIENNTKHQVIDTGDCKEVLNVGYEDINFNKNDVFLVTGGLDLLAQICVKFY